MEVIAQVFSVAMPIFTVLVLGEKLYGYLKGNDTVPLMDAISSSYSGITLIIRMLLSFSITIISYDFLFKHLALFHIQTTWLAYIVTFIVVDFQGYWGHRLVHKVNFLWNRHLIHHSSEEFNLACALRQSVTNFVNVLFFLSIPAALLGLEPKVIAIIIPIHGFAQYWYHTRWIGKLGFLEYIIVTPSQHRVHHALNPVYIDKNFSGIFCIWDRMFGTFQEELENEPPVYGITRPSRTYNPVTINLEHLLLLFKDAWRAENWMDKLTIWFRPTGWRPEGFEEKYPVVKIADPHSYRKYNPGAGTGLRTWSTIQFASLFLLVIYTLHNFTQVEPTGLMMFGLFVFMQIYSATELMDRNKQAPLYAIITMLTFTGIYLYNADLFRVFGPSDLAAFLLLSFLALQAILAFVFTTSEARQDYAMAQAE